MIKTTNHVEAEESLLGAVVLDQSTLDVVSTIVDGDDFSDRDLGEAFDLICAMRSIGKPLTDRAILTELKSMGAIKEGRLSKERLGLIFANAVASDAKYFAERVREQSMQRGLSAVVDLADRGQAAGEPATNTITAIRTLLDTIESRANIETITIGQAAKKLIEELKAPKRPATVFTGLEMFDRTIGGYRPGEFVIIAARPGMGKTSLALQIAHHNTWRGNPVLAISLEMQASELATRLLCQATTVDSRDVRQSRMDRTTIQELETASESLHGVPLHVWDMPRATIQQIRAVSRYAKAKHRVGLVIVDYIGLIEAEDRRLPRHEHISTASRQLKQMAKELAVPVFALCQLNRQADGEEPQLSHLRDSGSIEQDADVVILIHANEDEHQLIVAKHRHGSTGKVGVKFDAAKTQFGDTRAVECNLDDWAG